MSKQELAELMTFICACFPNFEATEPTIMAWEKLLSSYAFDDVKEGIMNFVKERNSAFAPTVSQAVAETKAVTSKRLRAEANEKLFKNRRKELRERRPVALLAQLEERLRG